MPAADKPCGAIAYRNGFTDSIPVFLGFVPFGLVLGAQATGKGFSVVEVPLLTGLNFGGGSEFAAIALWTSPPHIALLIAVTFLINSRHLLMGMTLAPLLRHLPRRKVIPALFLMCDEVWAMSLAEARRRKGLVSLPYYLGVATGLYGAWILGTTAGAMIGPSLGDLSRIGFDMAFPAVFIVMLAGMWKGTRVALPWLVSLGCDPWQWRPCRGDPAFLGHGSGPTYGNGRHRRAAHREWQDSGGLVVFWRSGSRGCVLGAMMSVL